MSTSAACPHVPFTQASIVQRSPSSQSGGTQPLISVVALVDVVDAATVEVVTDVLLVVVLLTSGSVVVVVVVEMLVAIVVWVVETRDEVVTVDVEVVVVVVGMLPGHGSSAGFRATVAAGLMAGPENVGA